MQQAGTEWKEPVLQPLRLQELLPFCGDWIAAAILDKNRDDRVGLMCGMAKEADNGKSVYKDNTPLHGTGNYVHG